VTARPPIDPDACALRVPALNDGHAGIDRRRLLALGAGAAALSLLPPGSPAAAPAITAVARDPAQRPLLRADPSRLLDTKCRAKPVMARREIELEQRSWLASEVVSLVMAEGAGRSGGPPLRFRTLLRNEAYIAQARSANGSFTGDGVLFAGMPFAAFITRKLAPAQDWSEFDRLSLWCYVHPTENPVNSFAIQFLCDGATAGPADPVAVHYFADLVPGEWHHLTWEFPEIRRDRVSQIVIFQPTAGVSVAAADPHIVYDFDDLAVEKVGAERVGGWELTPGRIAFSHLGYRPEAQKLAIAAPGAATFQLIDAATGRAVLELPVQPHRNRRGACAILDFSSYATPGTYRLRHGPVESEAFAISGNAWLPLVEATLNAFYGFRCGYAVPGAHDACHLDVFAEYHGEQRTVGGGWHDAANLTQGPYRTHLSIYALVELHDALRASGHDELAQRALEEARWGLAWSLQCRFAPGIRVLYGEYSYWTDGKIGTRDDVRQEGRGGVGRDAFQNTLAALATARASRALRRRDPLLAARLLQSAREDYADAVRSVVVPTEAPPLEINVPSWRDRIGYLTLTAAELYRATSDGRYAATAARFARLLGQTQERRFVDGIAVSGYFYEDAGRTRIVHEYHNSFEDGAVLAFAKLCEFLPDHPDWIDWYAGLALYADDFCARGSEISAPFNVVPAAVWRRADLDAPLPPDRTGIALAETGPSPVCRSPPTDTVVHGQMLRMFEAAHNLGADHRLRVFPLWSDHIRHGATTVQLSKAIGLGAAAAVMNRADLSELSERQLQWVIGANPLSRSLVYGIGYDYWQNFTVSLPNFVGGMSLGFNSYDDDAPAWGNNAVFPYKEQWVYSSCRIAHNLARIGVPARISGTAPQGAALRNLRTGTLIQIPRGRYSLQLAPGDYAVTFGAVTRRISLGHAAVRQLRLDPDAALDMRIERGPVVGATVTLRVHATGMGGHRLQARTFNCSASGLPAHLHLRPGEPQVLTLTLTVTDAATAWMITLIPDGNLSERVDATGTIAGVRPLQRRGAGAEHDGPG